MLPASSCPLIEARLQRKWALFHYLKISHFRLTESMVVVYLQNQWLELDESLEKPRCKCRGLHQESLAWRVLLGRLSPTNYLKLWKEIHRSPLHQSFTASDLSAMLQNQYSFLHWRSTLDHHFFFTPQWVCSKKELW